MWKKCSVHERFKPSIRPTSVTEQCLFCLLYVILEMVGHLLTFMHARPAERGCYRVEFCMLVEPRPKLKIAGKAERGVHESTCPLP